MSAYGQEPWARQALAELRRSWPDWAFLVVRYRWLALHGKRIVISATGPYELGRALPTRPAESAELVPAEPVLAKPACPVPSTASACPVECRVPEPRLMPLPTLAGLLQEEPGLSWAKASTPLSAASGPRAVSGMADDGGAGLSGPGTSDDPPMGALAAQRSMTGTWAVAGADAGRVGLWPGRWWPWGRRSARSRPLSPGADGPRHRRSRSRSSTVAAAIAT